MAKKEKVTLESLNEKIEELEERVAALEELVEEEDDEEEDDDEEEEDDLTYEDLEGMSLKELKALAKENKVKSDGDDKKKLVKKLAKKLELEPSEEDELFCPSCEGKVKETDKKCKSCGEALEFED